MKALRWSGVLPLSLDAVVVLDENRLRLADLKVAQEGEDLEVTEAGADFEETPIAAELRRAISRSCRGAFDRSSVEARLVRLVAFWKKSLKSAAPLVEVLDRRSSPSVAYRAPRLFLERAGSNSAQVSWIVVGDTADEACTFEVELVGLRGSDSSEAGNDSVEHLGRFVVPGGRPARDYILRRLRPLRRHRAKVRAIGPAQSWVSDWSNEVSFKTMSLEAAREAGFRMTTDGFFVPSERHIRASVCGDAGEDAEDVLTFAFGREDQAVAVKNVLDARYCKGGWREFVKHGARYSQPPSERGQRIQRMRLVVAAKENYQPSYSDENPWSMGPFYYEELGRLTMEASRRIEQRIAAAGGA